MRCLSLITAALAAAAASPAVQEVLRQRGERTARNPSVYRLEWDGAALRGRTCTKLVVEYNGGAQNRGDSKSGSGELPGSRSTGFSEHSVRNAERWLAASCVQYNIADLLWNMEISSYSVLDVAGRSSCGVHRMDGIPDMVVEGPISLQQGYALDRGDFRSLQETLYGRSVRCAGERDKEFFAEVMKYMRRQLKLAL